MSFSVTSPIRYQSHIADTVPQRGHFFLRRPRPWGGGRSPRKVGVDMIVAIQCGVNTTISRCALYVSVVVWVKPLPAVIPLFFTMSAGRIAGKSICAGVTGIMAVSLQNRVVICSTLKGYLTITWPNNILFRDLKSEIIIVFTRFDYKHGETSKNCIIDIKGS